MDGYRALIDLDYKESSDWRVKPNSTMRASVKSQNLYDGLFHKVTSLDCTLDCSNGGSLGL